MNKEATIYDFRRFRKSLDDSDLVKKRASSEVTAHLQKRRSMAKIVFIGMVVFGLVFYLFMDGFASSDMIMIYGGIGFIAIAFALSYYIYNRYNRDIADGSMEVFEARIESAQIHESPFKSKVEMKSKNGRRFFMPMMAFPKDLDFSNHIGDRIDIIYSPVSKEVLFMNAENFEMNGYEKSRR